MQNHLFTALALSTALGCTAHVENTAGAEESRAKATSIELAPDSGQLGFLKIDTVDDDGGPADVVLTGKVVFDENHTQRVASPIDGRANKVFVELGDEVKAGAVLLQLSSPSIGQLQADVQKARQDVALTKAALDRAKGLSTVGAIPAKDLAQAEADAAKAKADMASAEVRVASLDLALGGRGAGIRAQIAGTVVERSVLVGQEVRADQVQPLVTVSDLSTVWVAADLFEQDLSLVKPDAEVAVSVAAYPGVSFPGKIAVLSHVVDPTTHTLKLRAVVPNPERKLKPEMFARVTLRDVTAHALSVSAKAVLADTQPPRVVVVEGNRYKLREVSVGPEIAGRVRVLSGLQKGEKVVADGAIFLKQEIESQ